MKCLCISGRAYCTFTSKRWTLPRCSFRVRLRFHRRDRWIYYQFYLTSIVLHEHDAAERSLLLSLHLDARFWSHRRSRCPVDRITIILWNCTLKVDRKLCEIFSLFSFDASEGDVIVEVFNTRFQ